MRVTFALFLFACGSSSGGKPSDAKVDSPPDARIDAPPPPLGRRQSLACSMPATKYE